MFWDRKQLFYSILRPKGLQPSLAIAPQTRSGLLYRGSKCIKPMLASHNQLITWERENGFIRRKGWRGMLRPNIIIGCKTWAKKGKGFLQSFLILLLVLSNETPRPIFIWENMVIQFGDGIQGVKWLGNPRYPINSAEFLPILYFLQFLEVNAG